MRVFVTMLGFNTAEMIDGALENFEATTADHEHRRCVKTLFSCGYPEEGHHEKVMALGAKYGWWVTQIPNRGVMENHNVAIHEYCHMRKGDFYVCFDPDVRMQQRGWVSAMAHALDSDDTAVFVCAARAYHNEEWCISQHGRSVTAIRPFDPMFADGIRIARYRALIAWSMGMWKGEWLAARPRNFTVDNPIYGYGEHADLRLMGQHGKTWLSLVDYYDNHVGSNEKYTEWKKQSAEHRTTARFEEWVAGR